MTPQASFRYIPAGPSLAAAARQAMAAAVFALLLGLAASRALAQGRPIPDDSKRGVISHVEGMVVSVDGKNLILAPGANIRDRNNFIIVPTALPPGGALADYTVDPSGQVFRVWLLTEDEARRPKKKPAVH